MGNHHYSFLSFTFKDFNISSTLLPELESKLPVGSSANIILGSVINALAIATLCCCPPDN